MATKGYSAFSQSSKTVASLSDGFVSYLGHSQKEVDLTPLQRCNRGILQPQMTGHGQTEEKFCEFIF